MKKLLLLLLLGLVPVFASAQDSSQVITVATVNLQEATIREHNGHTITFAFDISNQQGAQGQIRYSAYLRQGESNEKIAPTIYDSVVSVSQGSNVRKEERYQAPAYLPSGEYALVVEAMTTEGLPLGFVTAGKIMLTKDESVPSLTSSCKLDRSAPIAEDATLTINCELTSSAKQTLVPTITTYHNSEYGRQVESEKHETISLNSGNNTVTLTAKAVSAPGNYALGITFQGENNTEYVVAPTYYVVEGPAATIANAVFDKESYKKGDTAKLSVLWAQSITSPKAATLEVTVSGSKGACSETVTQKLTPEAIYITVPVAITKDCGNPKATLMIKDGEGNILGEATYAVENPTQGLQQALTDLVPTWVKGIGYYLLALIVIVILFLVAKKWRHRPHVYVFFLVFFWASMFMGVGKAQAVTQMVNGWPFIANIDHPEIHLTSRVERVYPGIWSGLPNYYNGQCFPDKYPDNSARLAIQNGNSWTDPDGPITSSVSFHTISYEPGDCDRQVTYRFTPGGSGPTYPGDVGTYRVFFGFDFEKDYEWRVYSATIKVVADGACIYDGDGGGGCFDYAMSHGGSKVNVSPDGSTWQCTGSSNGGDTASCSAAVPLGMCGAAAGQPTTATPPSTNLCNVGTPSSVNKQLRDGGELWAWNCVDGSASELCRTLPGTTGGDGGADEYPPGTFCGSRHGLSLFASDTGWPSGSRFCPHPINLMYPPSFPAPGQTVTWTCSGGSGTYSSCSASRSNTTGPSLKVCQNSCDSGVLRGTPGTTRTFTLPRGGSQNLVACYNTATDCSNGSGNVTGSTTWTEGGGSAISVTGTNPKVVNGISAGTESLRATYGGISANMNVTVTCVPTVSCDNAPGRENYCRNETFTVDNGCGTAITCNGTNSCNYNWTEVAP